MGDTTSIRRIPPMQTYFGQECMTVKLSESEADRSRIETENAILRRDLEIASAQEALLLARLVKAEQMLVETRSAKDEINKRIDAIKQTNDRLVQSIELDAITDLLSECDL